MHGRVVGAAITLVVLLAVPTVASRGDEDGPGRPVRRRRPRSSRRRSGTRNNYFRKVTTIHRGDKVKWKINGFHSVTVRPKGDARRRP